MRGKYEDDLNEKSCKREKLTFLACADSITDTMISRLFNTCQVSQVTYQMPHVTCHLPPVINANSHRPSPADSQITHSRLVPDKKKTLLNHGQKTVLKLFYLLDQSCNLYVLLDLQSLESYIPTKFYEERWKT